FVLLFLGHAHLFLWTGAICFLVVLAFVGYALARHDAPLRARAKRAGSAALGAVLAVTPALLLFAHWYSRTFGAGREQGAVMNATAGIKENFGAYYRPMPELFSGFFQTFQVLQDGTDAKLLVYLIALIAVAVALARLHRFQ